jgi:ABC-type transporter lipoprotein component MlaA
MKQHNDDFGWTLGHCALGFGRLYHVPLCGASTVRDAVAYAADSAMWSVPYFVPVANSIALPVATGSIVRNVPSRRSA